MSDIQETLKWSIGFACYYGFMAYKMLYTPTPDNTAIALNADWYMYGTTLD